MPKNAVCGAPSSALRLFAACIVTLMHNHGNMRIEPMSPTPPQTNRSSTPGESSNVGSDAVLTAAAKLVQATGDLPAMPQVATLVMEKLSSPNAMPKDIHELLTKDQGLAARVLKVANSPYYGASRSISSLKDAVLFMGFDSIKSVVLTAVMKGVFAETGLAEKLLWEHSLGCGAAARKVAIAIGYPSNEEAFLAGMMHDLGKAILFQRLPKKMSAIMQDVYNGEADFADLEMENLGFTHAEVGQLVAEKWRFAINIENAIANHHHPERCESVTRLAHIVNLANAMCHKLEIGPTRKPDLDLSSLESAKALSLGPDEIAGILDELTDAAAGAEES